MHLRTLWVGKKRSDPLLELANIYFKRLNYYSPCEVIRLQPASNAAAEAKSLSKHCHDAQIIIALDECGQSWSTQQLVKNIENWRLCSVRRVVFAIGGADGHSKEFLKGATTLSLSAMTMPHKMALLVLAEQLYRAHTIIAGEPYHRS